jgi:hypothetical protein
MMNACWLVLRCLTSPNHQTQLIHIGEQIITILQSLFNHEIARKHGSVVKKIMFAQTTEAVDI